ncbi:MAG: hypothetical protein AAGM22_05380 [Acidobacteriota bacterium]
MSDSTTSDADFARIAAEIASDQSPVGIDAKKTHVMILLALERLDSRLAKIERQLAGLPSAGLEGRE